MAHRPMSMEAALDEERREVLAILEGSNGRLRASSSSTGGGPVRTGSPLATPRSPVQSMLDVNPSVPRHQSVPLPNGGGTSILPVRSMLDVDTPPPPAVRSMLDISTPLPSASVSPRTFVASPTPPISSTKSSQTSPVDANHRAVVANSQHPRSLSDASTRPADFGPRAPGFEAPSPYQFSGYLPNNAGGPVAPKRNTQGGKKPQIPSAMAEVVRGGDLTTFGTRDRGRHSIPGTGIGNHANKSKSPSNRLGLRSNSPHSSTINPDLSKFTLNDGRVIDMNSAYKRLSDANLAHSGGGLSSLTEKSRRRRTGSGDAVIPEEAGGGGRLEKVYTGEDALEDSSDEDDRSSEDEGSRGRAKQKDKQNEHPESQTLGMGRANGPRTAQSLMAAAEEERAHVAAEHQYRSLLDPEITVTEPPGARSRSGKSFVHPATAFDDASGLATPVDSDTEADLTDIKQAQKLSIEMTTVTSTPATKRSVRTIYRGDFAKMQQEAHDNQRRIRSYLVGTDLSDEAAHAMEWTIGTVLRDGDTLLAIYCVDEELGVAATDGSADDQLKEQATVVASAAKASTPVLNTASAPNLLTHALRSEKGSASASPMGRGRGRAEQERYRAVQDITDRVSRLLRMTQLQVKIVIEVIHCKEPKHLLTEVIDYLQPTLVILGSRGRSALKGVILGSFSNYLVTKSSVPVMVARKRLRKQVKRPNIKLANNLSNPAVRSLANASIDLPLR